MSYAFTFDASACTGCKACQAACKDKNDLPVGVLWRRVIEVSGGGWTRAGQAWNNTVFAYNLSMACNHCVHPKCAGVCPVDAYRVRPDGIVLLDSSKCAGCGYCNWACPYAVPQYNPAAGVMSKCNFCFDELEAGKPPACVAACPLRVLDYTEVGEQALEGGSSMWALPGSAHPFPLPEFSRTQPHMHIQPHSGMTNGLPKVVANLEEIRSAAPKSELPLVAFSLLAQAAVGALWASLWLFMPLWNLIQTNSAPLRTLAGFIPVLPLALGGLISFAHLGNKRNAWRMLSNLKKSWLSRELLALAGFGAGWLLSLALPGPLPQVLAALLGYVLVRSMASVYRLRSMAAWNDWRTLAGFLSAALLLGHFLQAPVFLFEMRRAGINILPSFLYPLNMLGVLLLLFEAWLAASRAEHAGSGGRLRLGVMGLALAGLVVAPLVPASALPYYYIGLLVLLVLEETLGRLHFYAALEHRRL